LKELVVISGKGGTGKTSLLASFAALAGRVVTADCDVDAADLHLVLAPDVERTVEFSGGKLARIDPERCMACGLCEEYCRYGAIRHREVESVAGGAGNGGIAGVPAAPSARYVYAVDGFACEGCGVCERVCPAGAVIFAEETNGEWYVSGTRFGPMVHARLRPGAENSGKLVTVVRNEARRIAGEQGYDLLLIDGSPGIGCPVIASLTGANLVLVVTEPTKSGIHDLERVIELVRHFDIPAAVAVNKADINEDMTETISKYTVREGITMAGRIRYDTEVTRAQMEGRSVVEISDGPAATDIRAIWDVVRGSIRERIGQEQEGA
jgi:MinD superfamily P-loop ATPase